MKTKMLGCALGAALLLTAPALAQQFTTKTTTVIVDNPQVDPVLDRAAAMLAENQNLDPATNQAQGRDAWGATVRDFDNVRVIRATSGNNYRAVPFGNLVTNVMVCNLSGHTARIAPSSRDASTGKATPDGTHDIAPKACWVPDDQDQIYEVDMAPSPDGGDGGWYGLVMYSR